MSLAPFTPVGVEEKLLQLYALPDDQLNQQAEMVQQNFNTWIRSNFVLNSAQINYLDNMDKSATDYYAAQCAICFIHRLDISLIYPGAPSTPGYSKYIRSEDTIILDSHGSGNSEATGALTFVLEYRS